ncbi:ADP-ribose pyrophosphatase NudF [Gottschalkia purinilytica]|uniref:ADP-ribose pyrophosphatase NudF n=1 Tax=Gottschalkia purinilytica TaxID=1503 RepID=A0A0L0W7Z6_GOTPU|nr:NUDIX hydrolase [Gottschalkia purinilytica]KNF07420.1 ADP-ribose pyrophosphatase NudF [Gottschalkia purinilytica]
MGYEEKTMKSEKIYDGKVLSLRIDTVELPDKKYSKREIIEHPGAVAVIPVTEEDEIVLVNQFRKAVESELLELPAGKLEHGEEPIQCAARELKEETGYESSQLEFVSEFYTSPGFCNEKIFLYIAKGLIEGEATPDDGEYIDIKKIKIKDLDKIIAEGKIIDAKTLIGALTVKSQYTDLK